ncbi:MAG TPA: nitrilase-related carbon-nitrogen hydrolase, partial [Candidatus Binatia bacterium]
MSKIAVAQIQSTIVKEENLRTALALIKEAKNQAAEIIAFPEFLMAFSPANQSAEELSELAESVDGPFINSLRKTAKAVSV